MMNKTILVLDDEPHILELIAVNLEKHGFEPVTFEFIDPFWQYLDKKIPALIVLDLMLNDGDGFDVCKQLKLKEKFSHIPILMLTARGEETDKIIGLEIGADDYMTKPFSPREMIARVKAILRRSENPAPKSSTIIINNELEIDITKHEVKLRGKSIDLTATEFKLLKILAERRSWVFSRDQLLDYLWGNDKIVIDRTIDVHIKNLREKLGDFGELIKNIRGVGYKMEE